MVRLRKTDGKAANTDYKVSRQHRSKQLECICFTQLVYVTVDLHTCTTDHPLQKPMRPVTKFFELSARSCSKWCTLKWIKALPYTLSTGSIATTSSLLTVVLNRLSANLLLLRRPSEKKV
eukprot:5427619-Amphidinium_carterae.1